MAKTAREVIEELAVEADFIDKSICPGLKEDFVYADYECGNVSIKVAGPADFVARLLWFAYTGESDYVGCDDEECR